VEASSLWLGLLVVGNRSIRGGGFRLDELRDDDHLLAAGTGSARAPEIVPTAVLLASADGSFYVGQTLGPNGGDVML